MLKRVLFIYAKLNPGVRYVQGMVSRAAAAALFAHCRSVSLMTLLFHPCFHPPPLACPHSRSPFDQNEVLAPLYYVMASDHDESKRKFAESSVFFCFTNLMAEIMNLFIKTLDSSEVR